jgi:polyisoprenoid-binding protein YceI
MNRIRTAALVGLATVCFVGLADAKLSRTSDAANAHFHASGPAGMAIDGNTPDVAVQDDGTNVKVVVTLTNLTTGVQLRDDHTRNKYLEVGKYSTATLTVARSALKFPADGGTTSGDAPGTMNIHGKDKAITFHYTASKKGAAITVAGSAALDITDYGINVPSYLGVSVKKDVSVDVKFVATDS